MADLIDVLRANALTRLDHLGATPYAASVGCRLSPNWLSGLLRRLGDGQDITLYTLDQVGIVLGEEPWRLVCEEYDPAEAERPAWCGGEETRNA